MTAIPRLRSLFVRPSGGAEPLAVRGVPVVARAGDYEGLLMHFAAIPRPW